MRRNSRGYTAVEILSAMTLFAIGAAGVIGMQRVTIQGGADARRLDMANNLAELWLARLQRDASFWTLPNTSDPVTSNLAAGNTKWIHDVNGSCGGTFCTPTVPNPGSEGGASPAFDVLGRDMPKYAGAGTEHVFCTQYRLNWIANPRSSTNCTGTEGCITALIRAEVRVFWLKLEEGAIIDCEALPYTPDSAAGQTKYNFVYATTAIRENAQR